MKPRVLYDDGFRVVLGPLGCFDRGQMVHVGGREYQVRVIDPDGAAVAYTEGHQGPTVGSGRHLALTLATTRQREQITNPVDPRAFA